MARRKRRVSRSHNVTIVAAKEMSKAITPKTTFQPSLAEIDQEWGRLLLAAG